MPELEGVIASPAPGAQREPILQTERAECALACLVMVARARGIGTNLASLRQRFPGTARGTSLQHLIAQGTSLGLTCRALRLDVHELRNLSLPCILHWDMNHFVVLDKVRRNAIEIRDPAVGARRIALTEVSRRFTGVALECSRASGLTEAALSAPRLRLSQLTGSVVGLARSLGHLFVLAAALQVFALAAPLFNQMVVDEAIASNDTDLLNVLAIGFGLLLLAQTAIGLARSWMAMVIGQSVSLQWLTNVFAHLTRLPGQWFERRHLGDVTSRFRSVDAITATVTTSAVEALLDGVMAIAAMGMMLLYATPLAIVTASAMLAYAILRCIAYAPLKTAAAERLAVSAREQSHFLETVRAIVPLKLFDRLDHRRSHWQSLVVDVQNRDVRTAKLNIGFAAANALIVGVENLLVIWLGARIIMQGQASQEVFFTIGMMFAFLSYKAQFTSRCTALVDYVVQLRMLGLHAERLSDIALAPPEQDEIPPRDLRHLEPSIELRNVSFRHGEAEPWVLKNCSFRIEAGEHVAVIGPSGCGKSTLLKILLGLLPPTEGEVLYGGHPISKLGLSNVRRHIGTVMQEDALLTGSIADNIAMFDSKPDQARIESAAALAQVADDIHRMPMGYQTLVGELGSGLSGGQRQRILIARALYGQPRILALDEATSHLDVGNERALTTALSRLAVTRLVIAHRPETIAGAQRVVQFHAGEIADVARRAGDLAIPKLVTDQRRVVENGGGG